MWCQNFSAYTYTQILKDGCIGSTSLEDAVASFRLKQRNLLFQTGCSPLP
jgi:hypothetical protein